MARADEPTDLAFTRQSEVTMASAVSRIILGVPGATSLVPRNGRSITNRASASPVRATAAIAGQPNNERLEHAKPVLSIRDAAGFLHMLT